MKSALGESHYAAWYRASPATISRCVCASIAFGVWRRLHTETCNCAHLSSLTGGSRRTRGSGLLRGPGRFEVTHRDALMMLIAGLPEDSRGVLVGGNRLLDAPNLLQGQGCTPAPRS